MEIDQPLQMLGGLTPAQFMKRHWQKKPLLVRQAFTDFQPLLSRSALFELAGDEAVESRLISQGRGGWQLRRGPLGRRSLPPLSQPEWTLLVQGVDLHHGGVHDLLRQFRFVPDARLDDIIVISGVSSAYWKDSRELAKRFNQGRWAEQPLVLDAGDYAISIGDTAGTIYKSATFKVSREGWVWDTGCYER